MTGASDMRYLLALLVVGCSGDDTTDSTTGDTGMTTPTLPVDVPPVTGGQWVKPPLRTTWHWQLQGTVDVEVDADLVDIDFGVEQTAIAILKTEPRSVFCYMSVGTLESFRGDAGSFPSEAIGNPVEGFPDESWLDVRHPTVWERMEARLVAAERKGCDGVELDHIQNHLESTGFEITRDEQLAYDRHLYNLAHEAGLAVAFKDAPDLVADLVDYADVAISQRCHELGTCAAFDAFREAGKPLLNAEFSAEAQNDPQALCVQALADGTRTLILAEALDNSYRVSCNTDFPSDTALADMKTYATWYGRDAAGVRSLHGVDVAIVQPLLTTDQLAMLGTSSRIAVYLSIGEIGLSNTYVVDGEEVLGQAVYDANPEWFLGENPNFDSWFADAGNVGWQDFVLDQAATLLAQRAYDGLFLDTVDTVDVYPETIPGMVELIQRLDEQHPDHVLIQNRGINVIAESGPSVDALMFEVFSTRYDADADAYVPTDPTAPGYRDLVEKALAYRLGGGVVLAQDFAEAGDDALICAAHERARMHRFLPSYADKFFQAAHTGYPEACPWPEDPRPALTFDPPLLHLVPGGADETVIAYAGEGGLTNAVNLSVGPFPTSILAGVGSARLADGESTLLSAQGSVLLEPSTTRIPVTAAVSDQVRPYELRVIAHDESIWVTNAGLSNMVVFDEPADAVIPRVARRTEALVAQPYAVAVDGAGQQWVVENVGDPDAARPTGRVLVYDRFELEAPARVIEDTLNYPTGIAIDGTGTAWIANSGLDWTGTERGLPSIVRVLPGESSAGIAFRYDFASYGFPRSLAFGPDGRLYVSTTYGLVLGFVLPAQIAATPDVVLAGGASAFDTVNSIAFDGDGDMWLSGAFQGASEVVEIPAGSWDTDADIADTDLSARLTTGLYDPWGIAFDAAGRLWVVNATNAEDGAGSLLRFDTPSTGATADQQIPLASRYTLGIAVARP